MQALIDEKTVPGTNPSERDGDLTAPVCSFEGKLFATNVEDAARFGRMNDHLDRTIGLDKPFHIVEIAVPDTLTHHFLFQTLDFMLAVYIAEDSLPLLNSQAIISEVPILPLAR